MRANRLFYLPEEISRISKLKVLNLSSNLLKVLPYSISKLRELQALWLVENQV
jgi:Leucine-rich repeat (LRR) protein